MASPHAESIPPILPIMMMATTATTTTATGAPARTPPPKSSSRPIRIRHAPGSSSSSSSTTTTTTATATTATRTVAAQPQAAAETMTPLRRDYAAGFSKSLGDHDLVAPRSVLLRHRHISEVSTISHAGYLQKRVPRRTRPQQLYDSKNEKDSATTTTTKTKDDNWVVHLEPRVLLPRAGSPVPMMPNLTPHIPPAEAAAAAARRAHDNSNTEVTQQQQQQQDDSPFSQAAQEFAKFFFGLELPSLPTLANSTLESELHQQNRHANSPSASLAPKPQRSTTTTTTNAPTVTNVRTNVSALKDSPMCMTTRKYRSGSLHGTSSTFSSAAAAAAATDSDQNGGQHATTQGTNMAAPPLNCVDPRDEEFEWISLYCLLEAGILYLYRNQNEAELPEAKMERQEEQFANDSLHAAAELFPSCSNQTTNEMAENPSIPTSKQSPYWEKRVALDRVGAVRSAELEYGPHSFELSSVLFDEPDHENDDQDDVDEDQYDPDGGTNGNNNKNKLVLRAKDADDMNEWLFQFHRSIATCLRNMVDHVSLGDIHHSTFLHKPLVVPPTSAARGFTQPTQPPLEGSISSSLVTPYLNRRLVMSGYSASSFSSSPLVSASPTLSHGHGRNSLHRRRCIETSSSTGASTAPVALQSTKSMPLPKRQSPEQQQQKTPQLLLGSNKGSDGNGGDGSVLSVAGSAPPSANPAPAARSSHRGRMVDTCPEHAAPQSNYPETERPPVVKSSSTTASTSGTAAGSSSSSGSRKYIPPHLRQNSNSKPKTATKYIPPHMRRKAAAATTTGASGSTTNEAASASSPPRPPLAPSKERQNEVPTANTQSTPFTITKQQLQTAGESSGQPLEMSGVLGGALSNSTSSASAAASGGYQPRHFQAKNGRQTPLHVTTSLEDDDEDDHHVAEFMAFGEVEMGHAAASPVADAAMEPAEPYRRGGCADPNVVVGSIVDAMFIPRKSSRLGKVQSEPFGFLSEPVRSLLETNDGRGWSNESSNTRSFQWEVGAVSECGVRESNEDAYLVVNDLQKMAADNETCSNEGTSRFWNKVDEHHSTGLFAVFDGHCGDQAARFAAEKLPDFLSHATSELQEESDEDNSVRIADQVENVLRKADEDNSVRIADQVENVLRKAIRSLDAEFCDLCVQEGRQWESGTTALIATLVNQQLVIANVGDARGVISRSVGESREARKLESEGWTELPFDDHDGVRRCFWKEVTDVHSPSREDERDRIHRANGWVTTEQEIPVGQLQRMVLGDEDVVDILKRCFADRYQPSPKAAAPQRILKISRVVGELSVSRSIGDRDFKASCNRATNQENNNNNNNEDDDEWDCPLLLLYPDDLPRRFVGDLVTHEPDFHSLRVGEEGVTDEFLLLACDGLWDVMDADDAVRVTRSLLFEKQWPAKKAAARLAQLAIHLGSSDNITVIVVRFC